MIKSYAVKAKGDNSSPVWMQRVGGPQSYDFEGGVGMPHRITDECIMCGACEAECPNEAISEGDPMYVIDPAKCDDCGTCIETCPNDAIVAE